MIMEEYYYTIEQPGVVEFKDKGSRFIAYAYPITSVEDFKKMLAAIKEEHPKATHHCFAYRLGTDKNLFRVNDDGEPSGTAGKPILGQIDSKNLTDILVIVVRYFGGTLLGVPGLINAYKTATALVLQVTPIVQKPIEVKYNIHFDYTRMNDIMILIRQMNITVLNKEISMFCSLDIGIPKSRVSEAVYRFENIPGVEVKALK